MSAISAAPAFKQALYTTASTLWASDPQPPQITYGMPAFDYQPDVISFGRTWISQDWVALGSLRPREELLNQEITFQCFIGGGQEAELATMIRAWALLAPLEQFCRTDQTGLGNVIRLCAMTSAEGDDTTPDEILAMGRLHTLTATFTASNRVSS